MDPDATLKLVRFGLESLPQTLATFDPLPGLGYEWRNESNARVVKRGAKPYQERHQ
jgi:hypothetical protein